MGFLVKPPLSGGQALRVYFFRASGRGTRGKRSGAGAAANKAAPCPSSKQAENDPAYPLPRGLLMIAHHKQTMGLRNLPGRLLKKTGSPAGFRDYAAFP